MFNILHNRADQLHATSAKEAGRTFSLGGATAVLLHLPPIKVYNKFGLEFWSAALLLPDQRFLLEPSTCPLRDLGRRVPRHWAPRRNLIHATMNVEWEAVSSISSVWSGRRSQASALQGLREQGPLKKRGVGGECV